MQILLNVYRSHKTAVSLVLLLAIAIISTPFLYFAFANGDGSEPPAMPVTELKSDGWVYAFVEYPHDWMDPRTAFLKIMAHPESKVPLIKGGYAQTDVFAFVRIRGIDTPRAMHHDTVRHRPHRYIERERENWDRAMRYVWNITQPTRTFRLHNLKVIDCDEYLVQLTGEKRILEADWEFLLGGAWHNLSVALINDEMVRPLEDGIYWDAGTRKYSFENPDVPK